MTRIRKRILQVLQDANQPLSASQIVSMVGALCDQATVYRGLHYLEEQGFAESFVLTCSEHGTERYYSACEIPRQSVIPPSKKETISAHRHWFHCEKCHCFIPLGECLLASVVQQFEQQQQCRVHQHTLYFTGLCRECQGK
ncbi:MAG: transcriptional repressor [Treponemataceae bacterium]|nr:transcriptional repressor [Treponemataceae bacterium]